MQSLPYELLQQISDNLLPRYQCRFALTSRQNYDCLYSPLLRWHAQKSVIMIPKHNIITVNKYTGSLIFTGKHVVLYHSANIKFGNSFHDCFDITNLSTCVYVELIHRRTEVDYYMDDIELWQLYNTVDGLPHKYLKRYTRYLHKNVLLVLVNMRSTLYISITNIPTLKRIRNFLSKNDRRNIKSCEHLSILLE